MNKEKIIYEIQTNYNTLETLDIIGKLLDNITNVVEQLNDASDIDNDALTDLVLDGKYMIKKDDLESIYSFIDTIYFIKEHNKEMN